MVSHLPYLKVVLISSHLTSPLSTTYNHLLTVCRRYKLPYRPGPHHLTRFRFRFGNLLVQILPPPIYNKTPKSSDLFVCMYLFLKACESCASPFTMYIRNLSASFLQLVKRERKIHLLPLFFFGSRPPAHFYRIRLPVWGILNLNPIFYILLLLERYLGIGIMYVYLDRWR